MICKAYASINTANERTSYPIQISFSSFWLILLHSSTLKCICRYRNNPWCCFTLIIFPCSFSLCHCQQICLSVPFISLYSFLWPTHSIFFLFVCLIVFQEDLCGHDRNIIETVYCQWEYNNSGDKYSMWLPKNHQFSLKENLRRIFVLS